MFRPTELRRRPAQEKTAPVVRPKVGHRVLVKGRGVGEVMEVLDDVARVQVDGKVYPMAFVLNYGKGQVFHSALGHDVKAVTNPDAAELLRRGCAWAAGLTAVPSSEERTATKR